MKEKDVITIEEMKNMIKKQKKENCIKCNPSEENKKKSYGAFYVKNIYKNFCKSCGKKVFIGNFKNQKSMGNWSDRYESDVNNIAILLIEIIENDKNFKYKCDSQNKLDKIIEKKFNFFLSDNVFNFLKRNDKARIKNMIKYDLNSYMIL